MGFQRLPDDGPIRLCEQYFANSARGGYMFMVIFLTVFHMYVRRSEQGLKEGSSVH